jgi:uncharacterized protein (DUF952 family)
VRLLSLAMAMIFHIAVRADWEAATAAGSYRPASLATEGFIHCSTRGQVVGSANRFFPGRGDLVLLCIDEATLGAALRYEAPAMDDRGSPDPRAGERFPHLYGPLAPQAVAAVVAFPCGSDGSFALPPGV